MGKGCDGKSYLENISKKLEDLRGTFDDRRAFDEMEAKYKAQLGELQSNLEKEREKSKLKNLLPEWAKAGVNGMSHLGGSGCVNNLPVDLAQELGVYRKILDAVGEEKEKERVEEVCKRVITRTETTTTSIPENLKENGLNGSI